MKIGIIDIDSKIGNLALMKISAYHKLNRDEVEWAHPITWKQFDMIYASSLFINSEKEIPVGAITGGPGFNFESLPFEIQQANPDYSIYPDIDFSFQKYSTGCPNRCPFCVIPKIEGDVNPVAPMELNTKGKWIYLLDSNFFASPEWESSIDHLQKCNQPVQWEGVDIRLLNEKMVNRLLTVKSKGRIHIAWDNPNQRVDEKIKEVIPEKKRYRFMCYVLIGFNTIEEQDLYRIEKLRELGVDPFVMPYDLKIKYQRYLARWVNHKAIFKSTAWKDYRE